MDSSSERINTVLKSKMTNTIITRLIRIIIPLLRTWALEHRWWMCERVSRPYYVLLSLSTDCNREVRMEGRENDPLRRDNWITSPLWLRYISITLSSFVHSSFHSLSCPLLRSAALYLHVSGPYQVHNTLFHLLLSCYLLLSFVAILLQYRISPTVSASDVARASQRKLLAIIRPQSHSARLPLSLRRYDLHGIKSITNYHQ